MRIGAAHASSTATSTYPPQPLTRLRAVAAVAAPVTRRARTASAPVTVIVRGARSLRSVMSQIQTQAAQLQALDLNALQSPLRLAGARALSDILPRLRSLLALALDNNELGCAGVQVISRELKNLTQLQVVSLANNGLKDEGSGSLALVLSSLTGLQTLGLCRNSISAAGDGALALVLSWAASVVTTSAWCSLDAYGLGIGIFFKKNPYTLINVKRSKTRKRNYVSVNLFLRCCCFILHETMFLQRI
jgi:hypothetical protein